LPKILTLYEQQRYLLNHRVTLHCRHDSGRRRFPFVIYYRWEPAREQITIYAIMHCSREPGYWHHREE